MSDAEPIRLKHLDLPALPSSNCPGQTRDNARQEIEEVRTLYSRTRNPNGIQFRPSGASISSSPGIGKSGFRTTTCSHADVAQRAPDLPHWHTGERTRSSVPHRLFERHGAVSERTTTPRRLCHAIRSPRRCVSRSQPASCLLACLEVPLPSRSPSSAAIAACSASIDPGPTVTLGTQQTLTVTGLTEPRL